MNSSDDEKLDAILREVSTPLGLKERLRRIPDEAVVGLPASGWTYGKRTIGLALAAGLAGIMAWIAWPSTETPWPVAVQTETAPAEVDLQQTNRVNELAMAIELLSKRIELGKLELRLHELERTVPAQSLANKDIESLVICLSDQSAIAWGAEPATVNADMQRILELYPNTAGAKKANEFLATSTDQNSMKP